MSEHDGLRDLLQKIAATVGDPPEHGLERVANRRRRRTRHRRGAVAAAVALAVTAVVGTPWLVSRGGDRTDVETDFADPGPRTESSALPDVLQVMCSPTGIDVPVAHIRPQRDGLNVTLHNLHAGPIDTWLESVPRGNFSSGLAAADTGDTEYRWPVPPGEYDIGCMIGGTPQEVRIDLIAGRGDYDKPELSCPSDERTTLQDVTFPEPERSTVPAAQLALGDLDRPDYDVAPVSGYAEEFYGYRTTTPQVLVHDDDDDTIATVDLQDAHTRARDGLSATGPWLGARVVVCNSVLEHQGTTSTTPPSGGSATPR